MLAELVVHDEMVWIKGYEVEIHRLMIRPCDCHRQPDFMVWIGPRPFRKKAWRELGDAMPDGET